MLKANQVYQKSEEDENDVNLTSKDMELNFSNKNEDEDELDSKPEITNFSKNDMEEDIDEPDKGQQIKFEEEKDFTMAK